MDPHLSQQKGPLACVTLPACRMGHLHRVCSHLNSFTRKLDVPPGSFDLILRCKLEQKVAAQKSICSSGNEHL